MTLEELKQTLTAAEFEYAETIMESNPEMPLTMVCRIAKKQKEME